MQCSLQCSFIGFALICFKTLQICNSFGMQIFKYVYTYTDQVHDHTVSISFAIIILYMHAGL